MCPVAKTGRTGVETRVSGPHVKHVLKVSLDDTKNHVRTIGTYNLKKDIYIPNKGSIEGYNGLRYDYGKFYASKTFFDTQKKRRILWGWVNESSSVDDDIKKGWSGVQVNFKSTTQLLTFYLIIYNLQLFVFFFKKIFKCIFNSSNCSTIVCLFDYVDIYKYFLFFRLCGWRM